MDSSDNSGVTTENILAILGAKEVENQILRQQAAVHVARAEAQRQRIAELNAQLEALSEAKTDVEAPA